MPAVDVRCAKTVGKGRPCRAALATIKWRLGSRIPSVTIAHDRAALLDPDFGWRRWYITCPSHGERVLDVEAAAIHGPQREFLI